MIALEDATAERLLAEVERFNVGREGEGIDASVLEVSRQVWAEKP
jgi:hypothetical protein